MQEAHKGTMYRFIGKLKEGFDSYDAANLLPPNVKLVDSFEDICYLSSSVEEFVDTYEMFEWIEEERQYRTCCG